MEHCFSLGEPLGLERVVMGLFFSLQWNCPWPSSGVQIQLLTTRRMIWTRHCSTLTWASQLTSPPKTSAVGGTRTVSKALAGWTLGSHVYWDQWVMPRRNRHLWESHRGNNRPLSKTIHKKRILNIFRVPGWLSQRRPVPLVDLRVLSSSPMLL